MTAGASAPDSLMRLQQLLLPAHLPSIGCTEAAAAYRPHNDELRVGGDWFDLIDRPESNSVVAVVGDVVGHGVEQIGVMGQLRAAANALAHTLDGPDEIMAGLDRFAAHVPGASMATVAVAVIDGTTRARVCHAGHPPVIRVSRDGRAQVVGTGRRPPLTFPVGTGVRPADCGELTFDTGDLMVLYTDGVVERRHRPFDEGLVALMSHLTERSALPCSEIARSVVDDFAADADDDRVVVVLRSIHDRSAGYQLEHSTATVIV